MRLRIGKWLLTAWWVGWASSAFGQIGARTNPVETGLILGWNSLIVKQQGLQTGYMASMAAIQGAMSQEFTEMKGWQRKYNHYLKEARGYAAALKAGAALFSEGVMTFVRLANLEKAVSVNQQGIAATFSMNNMYVETAVEMIKTYRLFKIALDKGGAMNMLNGTERTELLWMMDEQLAQMNRKLHHLAISIAFYNLKDVWTQRTAGLIECNREQVARQAMDRWKRAQKVSSIIN